MEVFKEVKGYEGIYKCSNYGRLFSQFRVDKAGRRRGGRFLNPITNTQGYLTVNLSKDGNQKTYGIHKLVALSFVSGYKEGLVVNHIDEDNSNNNPTNLEWVTHQYNSEYSLAKHYLVTHPCGKEENVFNMNKFCSGYGLEQSNMTQIAKGTRKCHKGFKCKYL